ncbi:MAG: PHB depolymerase family esterase [Gemmatimonadaceae bacterium]
MRSARARRLFRDATIAIGLLPIVNCTPDGIFGAHGSWKPGTAGHTVMVGSLARDYLLHIPLRPARTLAGTTLPFPLYVVLHGSSATAEDIRQSSQMDPPSELQHFLVAYPSGVRGAGGLFPSDWNVGSSCCGAAGRENIDDLGFIAALIRQTSKNVPVDPHRIYIVGFSDGGRLAYHAACKLAPLIAAVGVVSGSLLDDTCVPSRSVAVIAIHGTSDTQVPYYDNALTPPPSPVTGIATQLPTSVQFWIATNGCNAGSATSLSPSVVRTAFPLCARSPVSFYTIAGGTHAWPGEPGGVGSQPPMSELAATRVIVDFLSRQTRP